MSDDVDAVSPPSGSRVVLLVRRDCHLCDDARLVLTGLAETPDSGLDGWSEVDVDADPALAERYGEYVPVVTVDGAQVCFWRVDADRVRRALDGRPV